MAGDSSESATATASVGHHHSQRAGVFISYARVDGADAAVRLRTLMTDQGIHVWHDLSDLQGGDAWWEQIRDALARVEFVLLVLTDGALRSAIVQRECHYARQQGVYVCPITLRDRPLTEPQARWIRSAHWYDVEADASRLLNDLRRTPKMRRVPFMVDDLQADFVQRGEEYEQIIARLIDPEREEPVAITAALRGAGGYGKTTLARAVCHDPRIRNAFCDGVLWVTLGESPARADLIDHVVDLVESLDGVRPGFASLDAATSRLREALADRDLLFVVDDVWDSEHLTPFLSGGKRCARLITTRNSDTLPTSVGQVAVDQMQASEAVTLLSHGLLPADVTVLRRLAARLGEWPLLLKLANGMLHRRVKEGGQAIAAALGWMNQALDKRGVVAFDARNPVERNRAVARTIGVSLDELEPHESARFFDLAVFAEDLDIPIEVLEEYWGLRGKLDPFDVEDLCMRLSAVSLVQRLDLKARTVRLHDAVRQFLCDAQDDRVLAQSHADLLSALTRDRPFAEASVDNPYLLRHLAHHLAGAKRLGELAVAVKTSMYAAARLHRHKSWALQEDILRAVADRPDDSELQALSSEVARSSHVLDRIVELTELEQTLRARMAPIVSPGSGAAQVRKGLLADRPLPVLHPDLMRALRIDGEALRCLAFAPGGDWLLGGSESGRTWVFDLQTGKVHARFDQQHARVNGCALAPDGSWATTVAEDGGIAVWDPDSGLDVVALRPASTRLLCCAVHPDGSQVAAGGGDDLVRVWSISSGEVRLTLAGHAASVTGCAFSPDGRLLASVGADGYCCLWELAGGKQKHKFRAHKMPLTWCGFTSEGDELLTAAVDGAVCMWDVSTGAQVRRFKGHDGAIRGCAVVQGGQWILSAGDDATTRLWRIDTGAEYKVSKGHERGLRAIASDLQGEKFATLDADGSASVWHLNLDLGSRQARAEGPTDIVASGPAGLRLLTRDTAKRFYIWEAPWHEPRALLPAPDSPLQLARFSEDDRLLAGASEAGEMWVWNLDSPMTGRTVALEQDRVTWCAFTRDDRYLFWGLDRYESGLRVWALSGREPLRTISEDQAVTDGRVSDDGSWIIGSMGEGQVAILDGHTGLTVLTTELDSEGLPQPGYFPLSGHRASITRCCFSPDTRSLLSASEDGSAIVWDVHKGIRAQTLSAGATWTVGCAIDARNESAYTGSWDGAAHRWGLPGGSLTATFDAQSSALADLALSTDGSRLVTVSLDGTMSWFDALAGSLLNRMQQKVPLTCCALDPKGQLVATGSSEGDLTLWNCAGVQIARVRAHSGQINRCLFDIDGVRLLSAADDGTVAAWSTDGLALQQRLHVSQKPVVDFGLADDKTTLVSLDWSSAITVWDLKGGLKRSELDLAEWAGIATACAVSADGEHVAIAQGRTIRVLRTEGLDLKASLPGCLSVEVVQALPETTWLRVNGQSLWVIHREGRVGIPIARTVDLRHAITVRAYDDDSHLILYPEEGESFTLWIDRPTPCRGCWLDPSGRYAALLFVPGVLRICDIQQRKWVSTLHSGDDLHEVAWLDGGRRLVVSGPLGLHWLQWFDD